MIYLKPCPFCGKNPSIVKHKTDFEKHPIVYSIECHNLRCFINPKTPTSHIIEQNVEIWNRRLGEAEERK